MPQLLQNVAIRCAPFGLVRGGHKPGILVDFSERGKLREFCATPGENCNKIVLGRHSDICEESC